MPHPYDTEGRPDRGGPPYVPGENEGCRADDVLRRFGRMACYSKSSVFMIFMIRDERYRAERHQKFQAFHNGRLKCEFSCEGRTRRTSGLGSSTGGVR